ncbi:hypothetical protein ACMD2_10060, partial [Ananas comosus]
PEFTNELSHSSLDSPLRSLRFLTPSSSSSSSSSSPSRVIGSSDSIPNYGETAIRSPTKVPILNN